MTTSNPPMRTRAALLWDVGQPWSVTDVDVGAPGRNEVLVRLEAAGLCRSDHHLVTGSLPATDFPVRGGHEGAGVVAAVGLDVVDLAVGDHVVLSPVARCGVCTPCQTGLPNLCDRGCSLSMGAFAPYTVVSRASVVAIDPRVPMAVACLLGCTVVAGYGAATRSAAVRAGEDVAVIGLGGVGMAAVQGAVSAGARRLFVVDPAEWKRDVAMASGATHGFADVTSAMSGIADATRGLMAHKVVVAVGHVDGRDLDSWLILTAKGGTCVLAALGDIADVDVTANLAINILMQKRLQGSVFGGGNPHHDIPLLASLYLAGKLDLDGMVTREYRLDQVNEGFRDMHEGTVIRGVIRYTDEDWNR